MSSCTLYCLCCSVLQCVAVCCSVLQRVATCCSVLQCIAARCIRGTTDGGDRIKKITTAKISNKFLYE